MPAPISFPALGTTASLLVTDERALDAARELLVAEIERVNYSCSRFRADSELSLLNEQAGRTRRVSPLFLEAVHVALRAARLTDGAVDPTVGTSMRVLGYDRGFDDVELSGAPVRVRVERVPGWQTIEVDAYRSTVRIPQAVELDFGATAKALGADRAARAIADATGVGALVGLGGDIATAGAAPDEGWMVLVTHDQATPPDAAGQRIIVRSGGLATSGTTVRRWRRGEITLHHVIDPATGLPAATCWRTVSVAAASCVDANIASTAAIIRGDDAPSWLAERRLPARLVANDGSVVCLEGWPAEAELPC